MVKTQILLLSAVALASQGAWAKKLSDYPNYGGYDVLFTNPVCKEYKYKEEVRSVSGKILTAKPKDAYCQHSDSPISAARPSSPQYRLLEWINDPATKEIFFAYLSFSNSTVGAALCKAVERGVKLTFVLDRGIEDPANPNRQADAMRTANNLLACQPPDGGQKPVLYQRGHTTGIGFAHDKMFVVNPGSKEQIKIVFSSGNLSSGVVLHHENWHFISADASSYFAQSHLCLMNGLIEHGEIAADFKKFIAECRASIAAPEEEDIQSFFVPGEGEKATAVMKKAIAGARNISIAAHRFSYGEMVNALAARLTSKNRANIRVIADDDLYWVGTTGEQVGPNMAQEFFKLKNLTKAGAEAKYMETNHDQKYLHHNKFLVFDEDAVFAGAGNLTGDAFAKNFENFYFITVPEIVQAFVKQYDHLWNDLATAPEDLPKKNVIP